MSWSCGRRQCRRTYCAAPYYCRCGLEFCSEACFIPEWYAEHQRTCPQGEAIRSEVAQRQAQAGGLQGRGGAAVLVATALSHKKPVPAAEARQPPKKVRYALSDFHSVGAPLGGGSYGKVTKVVHRRTGDVFAMKVVPKQKVVEHQMEDYLAREVKTQLRLQHPNILKLLYYFEDAEEVHLLLEFASGGSLFGVLKRSGRLAEEVAARYFTDVALALDYLHGKGVVHRDLKPENILMCEGDVAKLADFGWCAELDKGGAPRHTFCGTWDYLSPEMVNSEPHDHNVDIWAIGVLKYEMLTSRSPFAASSQVKALMRITKVDLQIPDHVSGLAADLLRKLLVKEPRERLPLARAVEHPWVRQFIPDAAWRLEESQARHERVVEQSAAEACALDAVATASSITAAAETVYNGDETPNCLTHRGSAATELLETVSSVPDEPTVHSLGMPSNNSSMLEAQPTLSTMPWEQQEKDRSSSLTLEHTHKVHGAMAAASSQGSSLSQSQATTDIHLGAAAGQEPGHIPSATAALLQALRDPQASLATLSSEAELRAAEDLPEATTKFLGALRSGSMAVRLQEGLGPLGERSEGMENSFSDGTQGTQGSLSSVPEHGSAKKEALKGLRVRLAERRVHLEQQRSALEEEQLQLEQQRRDLELRGSTEQRVWGLPSGPSSFTGSPEGTPRGRQEPSLGPSPAASPSQAASLASFAPNNGGFASPRGTNSSSGANDAQAYAELRSWVQRKTDGLRKDHGLIAVANSYDPEASPVQPVGTQRRQRLGNAGVLVA